MKIIHPFDYECPNTLNEALELLDKMGKRASVLAGGTDLLVNMKALSMLQLVDKAGTDQAAFKAARRVRPIHTPDMVISLANIEALQGVKKNKKRLFVGATTTMTVLSTHPEITDGSMALKDAASIMGSPIIRNRATIGGNLVSARPAADTAVAALALGAQVELVSKKNRQSLALSSFFVGPGASKRLENELVLGVSLPLGSDEGSAYVRLGTRKQLEIALVGAAAWVKLEPHSKKLVDARVSLGAVAPTPMLVDSTADALIGKSPTDAVLSTAANVARDEATPIDDFRGSAEYRLEMVAVLVRRALKTAVSRAKGALS